jgi:hypothetical protein
MVARRQKSSQVGEAVRPNIMSINAVVGDEGFGRAFGRRPGRGDAADGRIQSHLAYAEERLRLRGVRSRVLHRLRAYRDAGRFPLGESREAYQPTWIDRRGVRCAVAHLAEADLGEPEIRELDARYHNAFASTFRSPRLESWAASQGLTRDDLALIQPAYPPIHTDLDVDVAAEYRHAVAHDEMNGAAPLVGTFTTGVRYRLRHNYFVGTPVLGIDGAVGPSSEGLAYEAHVRLGSEATMYPFDNGHGQRIGFSAGFGVDAVGSRIERAWTVPVDVYWYVRASRDARVGVVAGPRFAVAGDRDIGGRVGLDFVLRDVWDINHPLAPRDIHVRAGAEQMGDVTFVGVSLAIATRGRFGFHSGW